jgi:hypothetical protein
MTEDNSTPTLGSLGVSVNDMDNHSRLHTTQNEINDLQRTNAEKQGEMILMLEEMVGKLSDAVVRLGERIAALEARDH